MAEGEELQLPEGVTASQATGKLYFAVTFKFNEVRQCRLQVGWNAPLAILVAWGSLLFRLSVVQNAV